MGALVHYGGTWQTIAGCQVYAGGAWRRIVQAQVYSGGSWRIIGNFVPPMSSPTIRPGSFFRSSTSFSITSGTITATPSGGAAPYTYTWSVLASSPTTVTINSPTLASTTVSANTSSGDVFCTLRCTVTDSLGSSSYADVNGEFDHDASGGGGGGGPLS